jgi:hypothetical protein
MNSQSLDNFDHIKPLVLIDGSNIDLDKIDIILSKKFKYIILSSNDLVTKFLGYVKDRTEKYDLTVIFCDDVEVEIQYIVRNTNSMFFCIFLDGNLSDLEKLKDRAIQKLLNKEKFLAIQDSKSNIIFISNSFKVEGFNIKEVIEQLSNYGLIEKI